MNLTLRTILMACAIAALITSPAWGQSDMRDVPPDTPEAETGQPGTGQPMEGAPPMGTEPGGYATPERAGQDNPLYNLTPNDLRRGEVLDPQGEKVGTIKTVVLEPGSERVHAVISSGGILGIGAREVTVSFDELQLADDKVHVSMPKEMLRERPEYTPEEYVELEPDRPISEFSAFEPMTNDSAPPVAPEPR
jgi:sporulation protein YlmC with PRC-barrel domain